MAGKVLIVKSSARQGSNSSLLADAAAEGVRLAGGEAEVVDISGLTINPCTGCMSCTDKKGCVQQDDMQNLYPKVAQAQGMVCAMPIYWFNMSGIFKNFIDRCFAVALQGGFRRKTLSAIFAYGDTDAVASGCINAIRCMQDIAAYTDGKWAGYVDIQSGAGQEKAAAEKARALGEKVAKSLG